MNKTVPTSPWTSLTASNGGSRKLGPTSGMGQCLADGMPRRSRSGQASVT